MGGNNIASEIKGLVGDLERANPSLSVTARIKKAWNKTVDDRISKHVVALFVVPNTAESEVIVYVDSPIWAAELSMQEDLIKLKLNMDLQKEQIEKIKFIVSKEQYINKEKKRTTYDELREEEESYKKVEPAHLDDDELLSIQEAVAHIEDDQMRMAAYAAAKANLEWQKGLEKQNTTPSSSNPGRCA